MVYEALDSRLRPKCGRSIMIIGKQSKMELNKKEGDSDDRAGLYRYAALDDPIEILFESDHIMKISRNATGRTEEEMKWKS